MRRRSERVSNGEKAKKWSGTNWSAGRSTSCALARAACCAWLFPHAQKSQLRARGKVQDHAQVGIRVACLPVRRDPSVHVHRNEPALGLVRFTAKKTYQSTKVSNASCSWGSIPPRSCASDSD